MNFKWISLGGFSGLAVTLAVGLLWAAPPAVEILELNGLLVDNVCVEEHKNNLPEYVKTYTKAYALTPEHQAAGYSLMTPDGLVTPFESKSFPKIVKYLKQSKSKLRVTVKARLVEEKLELVSIRDLVRSKPGKPAAPSKAGK